MLANGLIPSVVQSRSCSPCLKWCSRRSTPRTGALPAVVLCRAYVAEPDRLSRSPSTRCCGHGERSSPRFVDVAWGRTIRVMAFASALRRSTRCRTALDDRARTPPRFHRLQAPWVQRPTHAPICFPQDSVCSRTDRGSEFRTGFPSYWASGMAPMQASIGSVQPRADEIVVDDDGLAKSHRMRQGYAAQRTHVNVQPLEFTVHPRHNSSCPVVTTVSRRSRMLGSRSRSYRWVGSHLCQVSSGAFQNRGVQT